MKAHRNKEKLVRILQTGNVELWNRYRQLLYAGNIYFIDLRGSDLRGANLE